MREALFTPADILHHVTATHAYLRQLACKKPQPVLNAALEKLVSMVRPRFDETSVSHILNHPPVIKIISDLHSQLSACEFALEKFWAEKILRREAVYTDFIYMDSYRALIGSEIVFLGQHIDLQKKALCFIGSGPLPITAFEMKKTFAGASMTCVDSDAQAITLSRQVAALAHSATDFIHQPAEDIDYAAYDVIFLASMTCNKKTVLARIFSTAKPGVFIAIRSTEELRQLLYEPVNQNDIDARLQFLGKTPYSPLQINTTLFYQLT